MNEIPNIDLRISKGELQNYHQPDVRFALCLMIAIASITLSGVLTIKVVILVVIFRIFKRIRRRLHEQPQRQRVF